MLLLAVAASACHHDPLPAADAACPPPQDFAPPPPQPVDLAHPRGAGDPCAVDGECPGGTGGARCLSGTDWPGGYCTSDCRAGRNDPVNGLNPDCPGGRATCMAIRVDGSLVDRCVALCLPSAYDCQLDRVRYSCSGERPYPCLPSPGVQCDFRVAGSCGAGRACVWRPSDLVGMDGSTCEAACDLLAAPPGCNCHRSALGEGYCDGRAVRPAAASPPCPGGKLTCPAGTDCNVARRPPTCEARCTPTDRSRCAPCATCDDVRLGVGVCSTSRAP